VIDPAFQNRGLGGLLFDEISQIASESGLKKLVARIVTARAGVIKAFERSGFDRIATLRNYVKDIHQNYADIAIMVKELASKTSTGG
jgi:L-amino acid N-acyltransferase YncA